MFRLKVKRGRKYVEGVREYPTIEEAQKRVEELKKVGIVAKVMTKSESMWWR